MSKPLHTILTAACALFILTRTPPAAAVPPAPDAAPPFPVDQEEGPLVEAAFWVDHDAVAPGQVFWVAVSFKIRPDWHIYWPGHNDTGMPPDFGWELPEGWKVGRARWPAPERSVGPGGMLDHVLEGNPTVLFPVKVPDDADTRRPATIACDIEWLVCQTMCIAERQRVEFAFRPFSGAEPESRRRAQDAAVIAMARKQLPAPIVDADPPIRVTLEGDTLLLASDSTGRLIFAPGETGRAVRDPLSACVGQEGRPLRITLEDADASVRGVVTVEEMGRPPRSYHLRIPELTREERDGFAHPVQDPVP